MDTGAGVAQVAFGFIDLYVCCSELARKPPVSSLVTDLPQGGAGAHMALHLTIMLLRLRSVVSTSFGPSVHTQWLPMSLHHCTRAEGTGFDILCQMIQG